MITFDELKSRYMDKTKDSSSTNETRGEELINEYQGRIIGLRNFGFMEKESTPASVASQQAYQLPVDSETILGFWVVVGGVTYYPEEVHDVEYWQQLNRTSVSADITP